MGCASSTETIVDPHTGQQKTKKKLGGAYPGQRRPQHQPYVPPDSAFGKDGTATAHFIAHGGGNALTLVQADGSHAPQVGGGGGSNGYSKPQPEYIQVTLPDGVVAGQTIHVQSPDGRLNEIVIPPGFGPGSTFTVEFAPDDIAVESAPPSYPTTAAAPAATSSYYQPVPTNNNYYQPPPQQQQPNNNGDDGFVSGFANPYSNSRPPSAPVAVPVTDGYYSTTTASAYPTSTTAQYPKY